MYSLIIKSFGFLYLILVFLPFVIYVAMVPGYWLTEGGQSATGALLDHIVENHLASPLVSNHAASQGASTVISIIFSRVVKTCNFYRRFHI